MVLRYEIGVFSSFPFYVFLHVQADPSSEVDLLESFEYKENEFFVMRTAQHQDPGRYIMAFGERFR